MRTLTTLALAPLLGSLVSTVGAQTFGPSFATDYTFTDLGTPPSVPSPLGGIHFKPGDPNTLLLGGFANQSGGQIYEVPVSRDSAGHIVAFAGSGVATISAPFIDGGLTFSSDGVMFVTAFPANRLLQYLPGSTTPDLDIDLNVAGLAGSVGTCQFVPPGFPGAGRFKVASYGADTWFDVTLALAANGTYTIAQITQAATGIDGPEGIVYVRGGNTGFANDSVLVCEYSAARVSAYEIDSLGDPVVSTRRDFMTGLAGAEGAVIDPVTGDFLFSTFGGTNRVLVITGFDLPSIFCAGKTNSQGCVPTIAATGSATLSGLDNFVVQGSDVLNNAFGVLLWSVTPDNTPLGGGTLCLNSPAYLYPAQFSGGTPGAQAIDCSGSFTNSLSQAWFGQNSLLAGTSVYVQYVSRDAGFAPPNNYSLSDGLRFTILP